VGVTLADTLLEPVVLGVMLVLEVMLIVGVILLVALLDGDGDGEGEGHVPLSK
jgi:hypothetical protein